MNSLLKSCFLTTLVLVASFSASQDDRASRLDRILTSKVSIDFHDTPLRDAFQRIFHGQASFVISPDVDSRVSGSFTQISRQDLLRKILVQANATYRIEDSVLLVITRPPIGGFPVPGPAQDDSFAVSLNKLPLKVAFRAIAPGKVTVGPGLTSSKPITFEGRFHTWQEALCALADQVGAEVLLEKGVFVIRRNAKWWEKSER